MRFCAYCDENFETAEVKECIENMQKTIYRLQGEKDKILEDLIKINKEYRELTGHDYNYNAG